MAGLSRNGAYDAAKRGEIPVLKFGRKHVCPQGGVGQKAGA